MSEQIFFETDKVALELGIPKHSYDALKSSIRKEFPDDEMMYQLHLLRALRAESKKSAAPISQ